MPEDDDSTRRSLHEKLFISIAEIEKNARNNHDLHGFD